MTHAFPRSRSAQDHMAHYIGTVLRVLIDQFPGEMHCGHRRSAREVHVAPKDVVLYVVDVLDSIVLGLVWGKHKHSTPDG